MNTALPAALVDIALVLVFVAIGRRNHDESSALAGLVSTAWPFLGGLAVGWLAARAWRRPGGLVPEGIIVWLATVLVGMLLRAVSGQGTALSFVLVATAVLGAFLLGWRAAWRAARPAVRAAA